MPTTDPHLDMETLDRVATAPAGPEARVVTLTLLYHPEAWRVGQRAPLPLLEHARARAGLSRSEPRFALPGEAGAPPLSPFVSRRPLWLDGLDGGGVRVDPGETRSRVELDGEPLTTACDLDPERLERGVVLQLGSHLVVLLAREPAAAPGGDELGLVGASEGLRAVRAAVRRLAADASAVLVRGETGSGKELVAAALHAASPRRAGPFVAINMAAVPPSLAASELFGHARGAFSGAGEAHDGFFLRASGGTLFLDEVADTPSEVQAALLRVLETGEVQPLGARQPRKVDVRVVAATDGDLDEAVAAGRFRAPLFYRLAASEVRVPPLRERKADIARLAVHFLTRELGALGREALLRPALTDEHPWLPAELMARLCRYAWPGNVRQLKNVCHLLALASGRALALDDPELARAMPERRASVGAPAVAARAPAASGAESPRQPAEAGRGDPQRIDPDELEQVLAALDYRLGAAAEHFGIARPTLNELVDKHPRLVRAQRLDADTIVAAHAEAERSGRPAWRVLAVSERGLQRRMKELGLDAQSWMRR